MEKLIVESKFLNKPIIGEVCEVVTKFYNLDSSWESYMIATYGGVKFISGEDHHEFSHVYFTNTKRYVNWCASPTRQFMED